MSFDWRNFDFDGFLVIGLYLSFVIFEVFFCVSDNASIELIILDIDFLFFYSYYMKLCTVLARKRLVLILLNCFSICFILWSNSSMNYFKFSFLKIKKPYSISYNYYIFFYLSWKFSNLDWFLITSLIYRMKMNIYKYNTNNINVVTK